MSKLKWVLLGFAVILACGAVCGRMRRREEAERESLQADEQVAA